MSVRRRSRALFAGLILFVATLALLLPTRAEAAPYPPDNTCTVSVSDATVRPGQQVNLTGSGFPSNKTVSLSVSGTSIGTVRTDSGGSFTKSVDIPSAIGSGQHTIDAGSGSTTCSFGFGAPPVADGRPNDSTNDASGSGGTASTGFQTLTASAIAGMLLVGGGVLLLLGRRRGNA